MVHVSFPNARRPEMNPVGKAIRKKAYVATLEAFFAFFLTFSFIIFVVHEIATSKALNTPRNILPTLENDETFRQCILTDNTTCLQNIIDPYVPPIFDIKVTVNEIAPFQAPDDVFTESILVASNRTASYKIVKLYYWEI
ncbi:hypothetical protein HZB03_02465 [Candidatus Woesearchaeota archaeon]|nr:hypothetical protein [Candidatus Woesearchaeota archaeon]